MTLDNQPQAKFSAFGRRRLMVSLGSGAAITTSLVLSSWAVPSRLGVPSYWPWLLAGSSAVPVGGGLPTLVGVAAGRRGSASMDCLRGPDWADRIHPRMRHLGGRPDLQLPTSRDRSEAYCSDEDPTRE